MSELQPLTAGAPASAVSRTHPNLSHAAVATRLRKRRAADRRFRIYCIGAVAIALLFLAILFTDVVRKGWSGFVLHRVAMTVTFDPAVLDPEGTRDPKTLANADYAALWHESIKARLHPDGRDQRLEAYGLLSEGATYELRDLVMADPGLIGKTRKMMLPLASDVDQVLKGRLPRATEQGGPLSAQQDAWLRALERDSAVHRSFNGRFLRSGDSRDPQQAGILAALLGSCYSLLVTLALSFPLGVAAAVYLEELAPKNNRWVDAIEVNINNLAAVPSIVFGLLGLAVFLNVFGLPRSSPFVGGLVLSLMTLPVIIIAARASIQSVPPSIRHAAYGLGATPMQVIQHHVLPMAMPGILTGTIIGLARALGESAPLLMIGMVAFIVDPPHGPLDPATALPVQIFLWADSPERGFVEKTSAAILVLLAFLITMNTVAVLLRRRWERHV